MELKVNKQLIIESLNASLTTTILKTIKVNNKMQKNYEYYLTEPVGKKFHKDFNPELTPKEMMETGIFGGKYFNDVSQTNEYPKDWWSKAILSGQQNKSNYKLNYFQVPASLSLKEWKRKKWIHPDDPRGWVEWYFRYYMGRRHEDDERQIKRWKNAKRHLQAALTYQKKNDGKQSLARLQTMLHWAYDVRKEKKIKKDK